MNTVQEHSPHQVNAQVARQTPSKTDEFHDTRQSKGGVFTTKITKGTKKKPDE